VKVFLLVCHKAVILTFVHAVAVVKSMLSPIDAGVKDSGRAVLMLVNRQTGAINRNVVCALLTVFAGCEFSHVRAASFIAYYLVSNFHLFLY
jgi:hypothetical protein